MRTFKNEMMSHKQVGCDRVAPSEQCSQGFRAQRCEERKTPWGLLPSCPAKDSSVKTRLAWRRRCHPTCERHSQKQQSMSQTEHIREHLRVTYVYQIYLPLSSCPLVIDKATVRKPALWNVIKCCTSKYWIAQIEHRSRHDKRTGSR